MNKYLSLIFLYNRAGYKKILLILSIIPLSFLAVFFFQIGNPYAASSEMLVERALGGVLPVLLFIGANLLSMLAVTGSLNGRKDLKATHATTGYTVRRLRLSPIKSYLTVFVYYLAITLILWGVAIATLYILGKTGLIMAGTAAGDMDTKLALGMLRTNIGHALIPIAHPTVILFNLTVILAMAGQCAKSCYLSWHNGTPSVSVALVLVSMFLVWGNYFENTYTLLVTIILFLYTVFSFGDVISREKLPKGDPFRANKYAGIMDMDSTDFDDSVYAPEVNTPIKDCSRMSLSQQRRRYLPLGINLEKVNTLFGACIFVGIAEHLLFYFKFIMELNTIGKSIKGVSIAAGVYMPYFWELQAHTYYGYILAILLALFVQAYWNWEYYNEKTKSVFVMKRLPDSKAYIRFIWTTPVMQAIFIAVIMAANTVIDLAVYVVGTPELALHQDYLSHILPF